jgi:hypothetical protein
VFSNVADSYDLMNDAMSIGVHRIWKNEFVKSIGPLKPRKLLNEKGQVIGYEPLRCLDVAGGTGDISFRILDKAWEDSPDCKIKYSNKFQNYFYFYRIINKINSIRHKSGYAKRRKKACNRKRKLSRPRISSN